LSISFFIAKVKQAILPVDRFDIHAAKA